MANWLARLLRHRMFDEDDVARVLGPAALARIEARVKASEERHGGEIRIYVEAGLPWSYLRRGATPRERAISMFSKLGVWDTEANNGVLIYLLLAEHAIEIVADRGLGRQVDPATWAGIADTMREHFRRGEAACGYCAAAGFVAGAMSDSALPGSSSPATDCVSSRPCDADGCERGSAAACIQASTARRAAALRCRPSLLRRQRTSSPLSAHSVSRRKASSPSCTPGATSVPRPRASSASARVP